MPREITIDGLFVDDANHPDGYQGMYFFTDPDSMSAGDGDSALAAERPFPYERCHKVTVRGLTAASGKKPRISPNAELERHIVVTEQA
jgi:hypothetical protein